MNRPIFFIDFSSKFPFIFHIIPKSKSNFIVLKQIVFTFSAVYNERVERKRGFFMGSILFVLLPALLAGLVQGITGFGSGIVLMIFLPLQFSILTSGAIEIGRASCRER